VRRANRSVFDRAKSDPALNGMGTTMTLAVITDDLSAHIAHVGDSRCYLIRGGAITQISHDHTLVARMVDEGRITPREAETHPQRSVLTRALGAERDVDVDETNIALAPGDRLLLCSDGLTGVLADDEIAQMASNGDDLDAICGTLIDAANARGGPDNVTVVLVAVEGTGTAGAPVRPLAQRVSARARRRFPRRALLWAAVLLLVMFGAYLFVHTLNSGYYYVGVDGDSVAVYHGLPVKIAGVKFSKVVEPTGVRVHQVATYLLPQLRDGVRVSSVQAGLEYISSLPLATGTPRASPSPSPRPSASKR
jgi:protein phosphatase